MVVSRPWASGWRATPAMVWLPARPSPMAAPTAPPPSARPPPTMAPAILIALGESMGLLPLLLLLCRGCR